MLTKHNVYSVKVMLFWDFGKVFLIYFTRVLPLHGRRVGYLLFFGCRGYAILELIAQSE